MVMNANLVKNLKTMLLALTVTVAGCTVVVEEGPVAVAPPGPAFCPMIYDPVCAVRRGDRETFPNACEADRAGYRVIHGGACRYGRPPPSPRPIVCTREYRPVCARRGGHVRTFGNACTAEAAGYRIMYPGPC
jgi:hypothetical protein